MSLRHLSKESQEKLVKAGFSLDEEINKIQEMGDAFQYWIYAPLHYAASIGDLELIKELLRNKANINQVDNTYGMTPIMWAAYYGRAIATQLLVDNGARLDQKIKRFNKEMKQDTTLDALGLAKQFRKPSCMWWLYQRMVLGCEVNYDQTIKILRNKNTPKSA